MYRIPNLLLVLIMTLLFVLPASTIMYASGSMDNSTLLQSNNTGSNNTGTSEGVDFANSVLALHNQERALVGVSPLTWNNTLAADAQTWAEHVATTGDFTHSSCSECYGENLAARNYTTAVPVAQELANWVSEKNNYNGGPFDPTTQTNSSTVYAHYTQMVWNNTSQIGCGTDSGGGVDYVVCRYTPPGNIVGQQPY